MIKSNLSRLLGEKRWTQADLSRRTGIRPNTISALYNGFIDRVNLMQIDKICEVLNCNLSEFLIYMPLNRKNMYDRQSMFTCERPPCGCPYQKNETNIMIGYSYKTRQREECRF